MEGSMFRKMILMVFLWVALFAAPGFAVEFLDVTRVLDGNTLELSNGEKVRLIGVDTPPESLSDVQPGKEIKVKGEALKTLLERGKAAAQFTRRLVEGGKVYLTYDIQKRDAHGQLLAYVYMDSDVYGNDTLRKDFSNIDLYDARGNRRRSLLDVNASVINAGYARAAFTPPNVKYRKTFLILEKNAKAYQRGFWRPKEPSEKGCEKIWVEFTSVRCVPEPWKAAGFKLPDEKAGIKAFFGSRGATVYDIYRSARRKTCTSCGCPGDHQLYFSVCAPDVPKMKELGCRDSKY
jgi:micrococcal nuclease